MNLPHEEILNEQEQDDGQPASRMTEMIQSFRSSNSTIQLAKIINLVLTFLFGYRFMSSIFNLFGEQTETAVIFAGVLAGFALIALFDLPYHAWNVISARAGLSTDQIATAETAAKYSLYGSLAASIAAIVLSQTLIEMPQSVTYIATGAGLIAVALIAVYHMKWWHDFQKQSFEATKRAKIAAATAKTLHAQIAHEEKVQALERAKKQREQSLQLQELESELDLKLEEMKAKAQIKKMMLEQKIKQREAVFAQVVTKSQKKINEVSDRIVEKEANQIVEEFVTEFGLPTNPTNGANHRPNSS